MDLNFPSLITCFWIIVMFAFAMSLWVCLCRRCKACLRSRHQTHVSVGENRHRRRRLQKNARRKKRQRRNRQTVQRNETRVRVHPQHLNTIGTPLLSADFHPGFAYHTLQNEEPQPLPVQQHVIHMPPDQPILYPFPPPPYEVSQSHPSQDQFENLTAMPGFNPNQFVLPPPPPPYNERQSRRNRPDRQMR